jgi:anti-sigma factor RsiW
MPVLQKMTCDGVKLQAYHDGELPPSERAEVESHLNACDHCRTALAELRELSSAFAEVSLPELPGPVMSRLHGVWPKSRAASDRAVRRITGWMTAVAAAVLAFGLIHTRALQRTTEARVDPWELDAAAVTPTDSARDDASGAGELVQVAQWMAQDLSAGGR